MSKTLIERLREMPVGNLPEYKIDLIREAATELERLYKESNKAVSDLTEIYAEKAWGMDGTLKQAVALANRWDVGQCMKLERLQGITEDLPDICMFCGEKDFDPVGLKSHLLNSDCETFNKIEAVNRVMFTRNLTVEESEVPSGEEPRDYEREANEQVAGE